MIRTNVYLIRIDKPIARLPLHLYEQWASLSHDGRLFYIRKGSAGWGQVSAKNVTVLAVRIHTDEKKVEK